MQSGFNLIDSIEQGNEENAIKTVTEQHLRLRDEDNNSIFHLAVRKRMPGLSKKLLEFGANPYLLNINNESPLSLSIELNLESIVNLIVDFWSMHTMRTDIGKVILFLVRNNDIKRMNQLCHLENKSVIEKALARWKFGEKNTALHYAVNSNDIEMVRLLMEYGADPELNNVKNESAIDWANKEDKKEILSILTKNIEDSEQVIFSEKSIVITPISSIQSNHIKSKQSKRTNCPLLISDYQLNLHYKNVKDSLNSQDKLHPLVEQLVNRSIKIANVLVCKDIVLIFNLVTKIRYKNKYLLNPMLEALSKRAREIAETFDDHAIAIVYKLLSKLDNANSCVWQPMLEAFKRCTKQRWDDFNNRLVLVKSNSIEMRGRTINKSYIDFVKLINSKIDIDVLDRLGNIDKYNPNNYFNTSNEVEQNAINFLTAFWNNEDYLQSTITSHHEKCKAKFANQDIQPLYASCISFINVTINSVKLCLISTSAQKYDDIFGKLQEFVSKYNHDQDTRFFVLKSDIKDFSKIIKYLTQNEDSENGCAEKIYAKLLAKLFLEHGDQVRVTGVVNCGFYPYQKNKQDNLVKPIPLGSNTKIVNNLIINFIPCCKQCMENKFSILTILSTAQRYGIELTNNRKSERKNYLSPLRIDKLTPLIKNSFLSKLSPHKSQTSVTNVPTNKFAVN
jgi:ankyrin repeat protein